LLGKAYLPLILLGVLIVGDLITRFVYLGQKAAKEKGVCLGYIAGIRLACKERVINSQVMREKFGSKIYGYLIALIVANVLARIIIWDVAGQGIVAFIASYLAVVEARSIFENLADTGIDAFRPLAAFFCKKQNDMTGGGKA
jgi:hypothetical protein